MDGTQPAQERLASPFQVDWESVLGQHAGWLRAVIYARVKEPQAVEDVLQEVALGAVEQKSPIHDPAKVGPWLYRLAVFQSLMYRRRQGRRKKWLRRYSEEHEHGNGQQREPIDWLLRSERHHLVRKALEALPPKDAEILLLKYGQDWKYEEIARHLGITFSAVQTRLHRARQKLRKKLAMLDQVDTDSENNESL